MAPRTRIWAFGSAGAVVVVGTLCWVVIGGLTGQVIAIASWLAGLGGALLLVFFEVGLSEDRARAREEEGRRRLEEQRADARPRPRRPRWPRRPG